MTTSRGPILVALAIAGGVALWTGPARSRKPVPLHCPAARYLLAAPLITGQATPVGDAVTAGDTAVALDGLCEAVAPKRWKATRKGTKVEVVWPSCPGLPGKVKLSGVLTEGCATFSGKLGARRFKRTFQGVRSACGDGRLDRGGGEECDPPADGACDPECRTTVTATLGAGGGQVTSLDGKLTLDIPAGALPADIEITIRRLESAELPPGAVDVGLDLAYRLGPAGLQFQTPVTVVLEHDTLPRAPDGSLRADARFLFTVNGSEVEVLTGQRTHIDGGNNRATTSGMLGHFSDVYPFNFKSRGGTEAEPLARAGVKVEPPPPIPVGQSFLTTVDFMLSGDDLGERRDVSHTNLTRTDVLEYRGELPSSSATRDAAACDSGALDTDDTVKIGSVQTRGDRADGFLCYRCRKVGTQDVQGQVTVEGIDPGLCDDPDRSLLGTVFEALCNRFSSQTIDKLTVDIDVPIQCVEPSATTTTTTSMRTSSTGTSTTSTTATTTADSTTSTTTTTLQPQCGLSAFPECAGSCPDGQRCTPLRRAEFPEPDPEEFDFCGCVPAGQACEPGVCGECPPNQVCRAIDPVFDCSDATCVPIITTTTTLAGATTTTSTTTTTTTATTTTIPCELDSTQSPRMCREGGCRAGEVCLWTSDGCRCLSESLSCDPDDCEELAVLCPSPDLICRELEESGECRCVPRQTTTTATITTTTATSTTSTTTTTSTSSSTSSTTTSTSTTSTTSSTTTTTIPCALDEGQAPAVCGGDCPVAGGERLFCRFSPAEGRCTCVSSNNFCRGRPSEETGLCGGVCPRPSDLCGLLEPDRPEAVCTCAPPCEAQDPTSPTQCGGGICPPGQECVTTTDRCACAPVETTSTTTTTTSTSSTSTTLFGAPCGLDETGAQPICAGDCPRGELCLSSEELVDPCVCTTPCRVDFDEGCGGGCPRPDQVCRLTPEGSCACVPAPDACRDVSSDFGLPSGICGGLCPRPEEICRFDGSGLGEPCRCLERAPADEPPLPCAVDTSQDPPMCGGFCPTPGQVCQGDPAGGGCACATPAAPCGVIDAADRPVCGGTCPDRTRCAIRARTISGGELICDCASPTEDPNPEDPLFTACGRSVLGTCLGRCSDPALVCRTDPGTGLCACVPEPARQAPLQPCADDGFGTCAGYCPEAGQTCERSPGGACGCTTPVFACGVLDRPEGPVCGGTCPDGTSCIMGFEGTCRCDQACAGEQVSGCTSDPCSRPNDRCQPAPTSQECDCLPVRRGPCTLDETGSAAVCLGECANGEVCVDTGAPGETACSCEPIAQTCGVQPDGSCGGPCPRVEDTCLVSIDGGCRCTRPIEFCQDLGAGDLVVCLGQCPRPEELCARRPGTDECACLPPQPSTTTSTTTTTTTTSTTTTRPTTGVTTTTTSTATTTTMSSGNNSPRITSRPPGFGTVGQLYTYAVVAIDPDPGDTVTFSLDVMPTGMTIDPATGLIQWTPLPTQLGRNAVTVRARDPAGASGTQSYNVNVLPGP